MMYTFITGVAKKRSMFRCSRQGPRGSGTRCPNVSCVTTGGESIVGTLYLSAPQCLTKPAAGRTKRAVGAARSSPQFTDRLHAPVHPSPLQI